jgi:Ca2+-binding RTX toxin-like protein
MKTVNIKSSNKPADALAGDTQYILGQNATLTVDNLPGIDASGSASGRTIEIDGTIKAVTEPNTGVLLGEVQPPHNGAGGGTIIVGKTGRILNEHDAISVVGDNSTVINHGHLDGYWGVSVYGTGIAVTNTGNITATNAGAYIENAHTTFNNSGMVTSAGDGVEISGDKAVHERIVNTGTISGADHSIYIEFDIGTVSVINRGTLSGDVQLGSGNDVFNSHKGAVAGTVFGGFGNDTYIVDNAKTQISEVDGSGIDTVKSYASYTLHQGFENLVLLGKGNTGGGGNDADNHLTGNAGNNSLDGAGGNDVLSGGKGADLLTGGAGADTFVFKTGFGTDTVSDFQAAGSGHDKIDVSHVDGVANFHQLEALMSTHGSDTVIDFGHGDTLTLTGVAPGDLIHSDFVF